MLKEEDPHHAINKAAVHSSIALVVLAVVGMIATPVTGVLAIVAFLVAALLNWNFDVWYDKTFMEG